MRTRRCGRSSPKQWSHLPSCRVTRPGRHCPLLPGDRRVSHGDGYTRRSTLLTTWVNSAAP